MASLHIDAYNSYNVGCYGICCDYVSKLLLPCGLLPILTMRIVTMWVVPLCFVTMWIVTMLVVTSKACNSIKQIVSTGLSDRVSYF